MSLENPHIDIHDLIAKKLDGVISAKDDKLLNELLKDSSNKKLFDDIKLIWEGTPTNNIDFDTQAALSKVNNRIIESSGSRVHKHSRLPWGISIAASIALIIGSVFFFTVNHSTDQVSIVSVQTQNFTEAQSIPIPDGTKVDISPNSTLEYPQVFKNKAREVNLTGKAFFDVAHNKEKPFIIHTEQFDVQVVGTSFYVHSEEGNKIPTVSVVTGIVKLTDKNNPNETITLTKGQKGVFDTTSRKFNLLQSNANDYFWKTKLLSFDNATIENIINTVNSHYDSKIIVRGSLKDLIRTTTLPDYSLEQIIEVIQASTDCKVLRDGNKIILE